MVDRCAVVKKYCEQCGWAWTIRNQYRVLYERSEKRLRLLDHVAHDHFSFMHSVLLEYIYLQLAKLTDPAKTGRHDNLSAAFVANELSWPPEIAAKLQQLLTPLHAFRERIILPRQKHIAHAGLQEHLSCTPLGGFPAGEDDQFFETLQEFVNTAHEYLVGDPYPLDAVSIRDADNLVMVMRRGVAFEALWSSETPLADRLLREDQFFDA